MTDEQWEDVYWECYRRDWMNKIYKQIDEEES